MPEGKKDTFKSLPPELDVTENTVMPMKVIPAELIVEIVGNTHPVDVARSIIGEGDKARTVAHMIPQELEEDGSGAREEFINIIKPGGGDVSRDALGGRITIQPEGGGHKMVSPIKKHYKGVRLKIKDKEN